MNGSDRHSEKCHAGVTNRSPATEFPGAGNIWTRTRCGRGHLAEHPAGVTAADFCDCWCGAPRVAATTYRVSPVQPGLDQPRR